MKLKAAPKGPAADQTAICPPEAPMTDFDVARPLPAPSAGMATQLSGPRPRLTLSTLSRSCNDFMASMASAIKLVVTCCG